MFFAAADFHHAGRAAGQRGLIDDAQPAADAEKFQLVFFRQPSHQRQDFSHRLFKRRHGGHLRADVHLQSAQPQIFQLARAGINALDLLERDAEFVFVGAGGDFRVRVRLHVRVHAHGDGRDFFQPRGDAVDALQFRLALDVERINVLPQREFNFRLRFAHAGKNALARVAARRDDAPQFAAADDVEAAAEIRQRPQHRKV